MLNRFDRTVAILIQLQSRRIVRAQDIADRFGVSLRTVYRDIRALEAAGVPVLSEAGVGYSIMDGYRLPPVMFTREEAGSFVAAEKFMQQFTDRNLGAHYASAMYKLKSVLRGAEKDWVAALESQIAVTPQRIPFNENIPDALEILFESIGGKKMVRLHYRAYQSEDATEREVEPVGVFHEHNYWYLMAYCHLRRDYRQFRADRMIAIKRLDRPFTKVHEPLETYRRQTGKEEKEKTEIRLLVDRKICDYLKAARHYYGFVSEEIKGEQLEMYFLTTDPDNGFARWYLMFGDYAQIISPESLKERVREIIGRTQERL